MIYDVLQKGRIRAARSKTGILSLCNEHKIPTETFEGGVIGIDLDGMWYPIQRGQWLILNEHSNSIDIIDDDLFEDEFMVMQ